MQHDDFSIPDVRYKTQAPWMTRGLAPLKTYGGFHVLKA